MASPTGRSATPMPPADGAAAKPTLKTIAQLSGLAVPTVSRALNDAPDIGAETKRTVRRIAAEIGYVPNRAGVRLRTGRTNVISLVLSTEHDMMNHTARLIASIAGGLRDTPFHMIMTPYFAGENPMRPIRYIVETRSADAVIFNQIQPRDPRVAYLMEQHFPFATHGRTIWSDAHPWHDFDNTAFGRIALGRLAARDRRRVLMIAPPLDQSYAQHMVAGAREIAHPREIELQIAEAATSDSGREAVGAAVAEALAADPLIDGIVCASAAAAMAATVALEAAGRTLGRDIDLMSKEAIPFLQLFRPAILAIHEDVSAAGQFLARAAMQAIADPTLPPMQGLDVPTDDQVL